VLPPTLIVEEAGEIKIELSVAFETLNPVVPVTLPLAALIVDEPVATAVASPGLGWPEFSIVAAPLDDEVQVTELVRLFVEPSL
jgi:hypothetical protein